MLDQTGWEEFNKVLTQECSSEKVLTKEEEKRLIEEAKGGSQQAIEQLIVSNVRLVNTIAKKYSIDGFVPDDIFQEGCLGLIMAIKKFDNEKQNRLSTFAYYLIHRTIIKSLEEKGRLIRLPNYKSRSVHTYKKWEASLNEDHEGTLTIEEIAQKMNLKIEKVKELQNLQDPISLNQTQQEKEELEQYISDQERSLEERIIEEEKIKAIRTMFQETKLTENERTVITLLYGLNDNDPKTETEVGEILNKRRKSINRIKLNALEKLRNSKGIKLCIDYTIHPDQAKEYLDENFQKRIGKKH